MNGHATREGRDGRAILALLGLTLGLGVLLTAIGPWRAAPGQHPPGSSAPPATVKNIFATTQPARNPTTLTLLADDRRVVGWISGTKDFAGKEVAVQCNGATETVWVQDGNTFCWFYKVDQPADATVAVEGLRQTIRLCPPAPLEPSVFFVVDRTVYRPQQKLNFSAFLRKLTDAGQFVPLARQQVTVTLTSQRKKTKAAELTLTSDDFGRVVGEYTFSDGDVLDDYTLAIAGYKGGAKVTLADYRKSKIKLRIAGTVEDGQVRIRFDALDFLDRLVPGSKVQFTAQVVRKADQSGRHGLKAEDFVYHERPWLGLGDEESLGEEELLLWEFDPQSMPPGGLGGAAGAVLAQTTGDVAMPTGSGEHVMKVNREWIDGRNSVLVQGVLIDSNGREQRAGQQIPLTCGGAGGLALKIAKRCFQAGEIIRVTAGPQLRDSTRPRDASAAAEAASGATLVVMRLSPGQQGGWSPVYYGGLDYRNSQMPYYMSARAIPYGYLEGASVRSARIRPWLAPLAPAIQRTMVTAVPFADGVAEVKLTEPGAYMLVGVAQLPGGATAKGEVGCVVRDDSDSPLVLALDAREYASGETLTGTVHCRFADARALLTLRDSSGLRMWKPVRLTDGTYRIEQPLGDDLKYGCVVGVQYADEAGLVHVAEQFIRVMPAGRILKIETAMKPVCDAGEEVEIGLKVNRNEPVDLVVSVYDQSLLGIKPDQSVDIANFYLADERARLLGHRDTLRRRLGGVTLAGAIEQAQKLLKEKSDDPASQQACNYLRTAISHYDSNYVRAMDLCVLLECVGIDAALLMHSANWHFRFEKTKAGQIALFDAIESPGSGDSQWRLVYRFHGQALVLAEYHSSYAESGYYPYGGQYQYWNAYGARRAARGDAHWSVSMNSAFSEGQAFISHLPTAGPAAPELITVDADMSGMAVRRDFSDSAYWNGAVRTDATGHATVRFKLPDSLTNWQVVVTAITPDMRVGSHKAKFTSTKPIMVWPMLPRVFTTGDKVEIYGSIHNRTDRDREIKVTCKVGNGRLLSPERTSVLVKANGNAPVYWSFKAGDPGFTQILMTAECDAGSDASLKRLPVTALLADSVITASGYCKDGATLTIPADGVDLAHATLHVDVAPTLAADLLDTLGFLVDYPHGCVEQTMSRFLPAIKVAQVLQRFKVDDKALTEKLPKCVEMGIKRLLELQQPDGGWGWNGSSQTHEMMTPYALYGLLEAEKAGYRIPNETAVARGLARLKGFIDAMGENQAADRIYCMYVYAHRHPLADAWWAFIGDQLDKNKLSDYATALALEMAVEAKKDALTQGLAASLRKKAVRDGSRVYWQTANFSRWGNDTNEITAAAMKALVALNPNEELIPGILCYFAERKCGNRWSSTKDTAMIVFAMCDFLSRQDMDLRGSKTMTVAVNDGPKQKLRVDDKATSKLTVDGQSLRTGVNTVAFEGGPAAAMYRLSLRYRTASREIAPSGNGLTVARNFYLLDGKGGRRLLKPDEVIPRGAYIESEVAVSRHDGSAMRYVLVDNPKPATCEILPVEDTRFNQTSTQFVLREDKTATVLWHHEQTGRHITDRCVLHAELAGEFTVGPAQVELMYCPDIRGHSGTFRFGVKDESQTTVTARTTGSGILPPGQRPQ